MEAGIERVSDLIDDGEFITYEDCCKHFGRTFMSTKFWGIITAIPKQWKESIRQKRFVPGMPLYEKCASTKNATAILYRAINHKEGVLNSYINKWEKRGIAFDFEKYLRAIKNINRLTNIVKLRTFQYRLLLGTTVTNIQLVHFGIKFTPMCTLCNKERETLKHLFFDCEKITSIRGWIESLIERQLDFEHWLYSETGIQIVNTASLFAKYYIYVCKCKEQEPSLSNLKRFIQTIKDMEEKIAKSRNRLATHKKKWSTIKW